MWSENVSLRAEEEQILKQGHLDEIAILRCTHSFLQGPKNSTYHYSIHVLKIDFTAM